MQHTHTQIETCGKLMSAAVERYGETFGLPSTILNIAAWDHEMVLMWADAVHVSNEGIRRLADAPDTLINGASLDHPHTAQKVLEDILDEDDLKIAVLELEALRVLQRLQPRTYIQHHHDECILNGNNSGDLVDEQGDGSTASCSYLAHAEVWLEKLHRDMEQLYEDAVAPKDRTFRREVWGEGWDHHIAPAISSAASSSAFDAARAASCSAMNSDDDEDAELQNCGGAGDDDAMSHATESRSVVPAPIQDDDKMCNVEIPSANNSSFSSVDLEVAVPALASNDPAKHSSSAQRPHMYCVQPLGRRWYEKKGHQPEQASGTTDEFDF